MSLSKDELRGLLVAKQEENASYNRLLELIDQGGDEVWEAILVVLEIETMNPDIVFDLLAREIREIEKITVELIQQLFYDDPVLSGSDDLVPKLDPRVDSEKVCSDPGPPPTHEDSIFSR